MWTQFNEFMLALLENACISCNDARLISVLLETKTRNIETETRTFETKTETTSFETETKTRSLETNTETETIKNWSRDRDRSRDFNIPGIVPLLMMSDLDCHFSCVKTFCQRLTAQAD